MKSKIQEIKLLLKNDNILTCEEECYCYAQDSSNLIKPKTNPDVVVFAETIEDVQNILKYANEHEIPVISRGAGTNMVGSCVCDEGGIVLNFSKMNKILEIDPVNMTAKVQPGVIVGNLKQEAEKSGLFFPPDPSNYAVSTVGGAIAQSSGGAMGFKYGTIKDYVLSLKVVTADGRLMTLGANTAKDSVGYHLAQLMVGSEGTLAVIVEATLKLLPKPETNCAISAYFDNLRIGMIAVNKIIGSKIFPAAIDFMDKNAIMTVEDYTKCGLRTDKDCMLLLTLDGYKSSMEYQLNSAVEVLKNSGATDIKVSDEEGAQNIWKARRVAFAATARLAPDVVTDDIIVPRENLPDIAEQCRKIAEKYNLKMCLVGHAGDGNLHPQIAVNLENEEEFKNCMEAKAEIYKATIELGGTISAEHGVGLEKKAYVKDTVDKNAIEYMKMIKNIFDSKNILNPNKIF
ncbi:MAG: FAD-binding protein [bacterium]|nr:FAD-binding protein [bacterium]